LTELLVRCEAAGIRKVMAIIGDSANAGSVGLHLALGFTQVGIVESCGWKMGAWRDIVIMQKPWERATPSRLMIPDLPPLPERPDDLAK